MTGFDTLHPAQRSEGASGPPARLCLNMIVKNEAAIIERCLAAAAPVIAHYVICDTGSTDDTRERVAAFFDGRGIAGEIHDIPFPDFAQARNEALARCRASPVGFDYILLADADMELHVDDEQFRNRLVEPAYAVRQTNGLTYFNTRLVGRDTKAHYVGATHEYLDTGTSAARLDAIWFHDHACGANRDGKLERDLSLLSGSLAEKPDDVRAMFYLAQTYREAGRYAEARDWYERRIAAGGWEEEVWYSILMRARCDLALGDGVAFVDGCLAAYNFRPTRAEPLHELSRFYREQEQYDTALLYAEAGQRIGYPEHDSLFIDDALYRFGFAHEISIAGYYCKEERRRLAGRAACIALQMRRDVTPALRGVARRNAMFYAPTAGAAFGGCALAAIDVELEPPFRPMNPSLLLEDDALWCVIRGVNYRLEDSLFAAPAGGGVIRTRNYLARLERDGRVAAAREMRPGPAVPPRIATSVEGFEDCRLFRWREALYCTATVRDRSPDMRCEIALLELDAEANIAAMRVLRGYRDDQHQKNWLPFVVDDELHLLYLTDPTTVLRYDQVSGGLREHAVDVPPLALEHLRGGSQLTAFDDGWLYLTHENAPVDSWHRRYLHRFVRLDRAYRVAALTEPFRFTEQPIEFAAGLAFDAARDELLVSFGIHDYSAHLATIDARGVRNALVPVDRMPGAVRG